MAECSDAGRLSATGLDARALDLIREAAGRRPDVTGLVLFGSRAKGNAAPSSDIDLAVEGIDDPLTVEAFAHELDELPLPYRFDVQALAAIRTDALREHIARVGLRIYGETP